MTANTGPYRNASRGAPSRRFAPGGSASAFGAGFRGGAPGAAGPGGGAPRAGGQRVRVGGGLRRVVRERGGREGERRERGEAAGEGHARAPGVGRGREQDTRTSGVDSTRGLVTTAAARDRRHHPPEFHPCH